MSRKYLEESSEEGAGRRRAQDGEKRWGSLLQAFLQDLRVF